MGLLAEIKGLTKGTSHWYFAHESLATTAKELHRCMSLVDIRLHEIARAYHHARKSEEDQE
jgi:hypothetical protein